MPYRIIVHVGPWKTGSSALQQFFHINRERLLNHGVLYPVGLYAPHVQVEIPNILMKTTSRMVTLSIPPTTNLETILQNYFQELELNDIKILLLSSPDFVALDADQYSQLFKSLTKDSQNTVELIYFDFQARLRLNSYRSQYIQQGEHVDDIALEKIFMIISQITNHFDNAIKDIPLITHRINYEEMVTEHKIYEKILDVVLGQHSSQNINDWKLPTKSGRNISISANRLELLNQFNKLNVEGREFNNSCPLVFSNSFPEQSARFNLYLDLMLENIERDGAVSERDRIINSRIWRTLRPYRVVRSSFRKLRKELLEQIALSWRRLRNQVLSGP